MPSILVVEDDTSVLEILGEIISKAGYDVDCVRTHDDAVHAMSSKMYDLLIADVRLPDGKAYDLFDLGVQHGCRTILITGHYDEVPTVAASHAPYLVKPFPLDALLEEVVRQLTPD